MLKRKDLGKIHFHPPSIVFFAQEKQYGIKVKHRIWSQKILVLALAVAKVPNCIFQFLTCAMGVIVVVVNYRLLEN